MEATGLERHLDGADLCLTGEGNTDFQTAHGKTPMGVAAGASPCGVPVICLSGGLGRDYQQIYDVGIDAALPIVPGPVDLDIAIQGQAARFVADVAECALWLVALGQRMGRA